MEKIENKQENNSNLVIGIDDSGRGPVLGPMLLAGCLMKEEMQKEFVKLGIKDSKLLSPTQRDKIVDTIKEKVIDFFYQIITPIEIDTGFGEGLNLNQVEALAAANIINHLTSKLSKEQLSNLKIILDCPSINTNGWKNQLLGFVKNKDLASNIVCEHKADFNHPVVSAASIIAKVTRDAEIEKIKEKIGIDFGSGYPSDPYTKAFLEKHAKDFKEERIFRESWSTWQKASGNKKEDSSKQKRLF